MADEGGERRMAFGVSPPTPTASSAGPTLAIQGNCGSIVDWHGASGVKKASISGGSAAPPPRPAVSTSTAAVSGSSSHRLLCRPWDCGDLLRRLATFRISCWNSKPQSIGPAACARKGWINADIDIISCEGCDKHLRFEAEAGVQSFRDQLDSGHHASCPWKGNACSDSLAQFPSSLMALIGGYNDRCDALLQLHALPLVSALALDQMKLSRGPQIERLLAQPPVVPGIEFRSSSGAETFCTAQRIISFCGWEPRFLPHAADFEDHSAQSTRTAMKKRGKRSSMPRPERERSSRSAYTPACTLLECVYCGANVNLVRFLSLARPPLGNSDGRAAAGGAGASAGVSAAQEAECPQVSEMKNRVLLRGVSTASSMDAGTRKQQVIESGATSEKQQNSSFVRGMASTSARPQLQQAEGSEMGDCCAVSYESRRDEQQGQGGETSFVPSSSAAVVRAESTNGMFDEEEGKSCAAGGESSKRKRGVEWMAADQHSFGGENAGASEAEAADAEFGNNSDHRNKRICLVEPSRNNTTNTNNTNNNNRSSSRVKVSLKRKITGEFPCSSSVNATDTCFQNKPENSMDSVEFMPQQEEDAQQHTAVSGYTENEWLFDEPNSTVNHGGEAAAAVETTKSDTNAAVMSSGTGTGGGGSVGMMMMNPGEAAVAGDGDLGEAQQTESVAGVIDAVVENDTSREAVVKDVDLDESGDSLRRPRSEEDRTVDTTVALIISAKETTENSVEVAPGAGAGAAAGGDGDGAGVAAVVDEEPAVANSTPTTVKDGAEFDPIASHKSFCPWVNGLVLAAANGTFGDGGEACGWQLTVDALDAFAQQENVAAGVTESESTASMCKEDDNSKQIASSSQLCNAAVV